MNINYNSHPSTHLKHKKLHKLNTIDMAEVVAGAVVAEQVAATGIEAGAALAVAQPTLPLRATFHQIASAQEQDES